MVVEGFVLHRVAAFRLRAIAVAVAWYGLNDVVDYAVPLVGTPHHTLLPGQRATAAGFTHPSPTHEIAAVGAGLLTLTATILALGTRAAKERTEGDARRAQTPHPLDAERK
jgi:uncharacterized membrane protein YpjA